MDSTVGTRPNHYETLGLKPTASDVEIAQAFAREMSMFRARPMAAIAQISVAYETLRNPAKRRAYDEALGLRPEPPRPPVTAGFIGAAVARPAARPAIDSLPRVAPQPKPQAPSEGPAERRLGSFIAESLREPEQTSPAPEPQPKPQDPPQAQKQVEAPVPDFLTFRPTEGESAESDADERPIAWKRPAMAAGALILAVGFLGALAGSWSGSEVDEARSAEPDMAIALPAAKPPQEVAALDATPAPETPAMRTVTQSQPQRSTLAAAPRIERTRPPLELPAIAEEQPAVQVAENQAAAPAVEQAAVADAPAPAVAASLPLSNATIARTIHRIGYACGQVASTAPVEGEASGVFKVTCTSGQSYQARPVRGRYHFRRLSSR